MKHNVSAWEKYPKIFQIIDSTFQILYLSVIKCWPCLMSPGFEKKKQEIVFFCQENIQGRNKMNDKQQKMYIKKMFMGEKDER